MELSIVIPAWNEAKRLPRTLDRLAAYLAKQPRITEIIVVDDGSTDGTADVVRQHPAQPRLIAHDRNRGKGAAVRTGMLSARGDWRLITDADLSTPIEDLDRLWAHRLRGDVIIGSRRLAGASIERPQVWWKDRLGRLGNALIQLLVVPGINDTRCGFKLFSAGARRVFELQRLNGWGFDDEILFLARRLHFRIIQVPVHWFNDAESKVTGRDYAKSLWEIARIHLNRLNGSYPKT